MESRFGRGFGGVRVHTGPLAAAAASAMNARALTVGDHVIFGAGQYHPETPPGLRLLAHELAHVVQQGRDARPALPVSFHVGRQDDPLEREAELVADRILTRAPLPPLSRDDRGVVRRAVRLALNSADIDDASGDAVPTVALNQGSDRDHAVFNLTRGYNRDLSRIEWAFEFIGHVDTTLGPGDSLADWRFGFVQFVRQNFLGLYYAGRKDREGSVQVLVHPVITQSYFVDIQSGSRWPPFMITPSSRFEHGEVNSHMGDHPYLSIRQHAHNFTTGVSNYLFYVIDDADAWTIFTVRDDGGRYYYLAHIQWFRHHEVMFRWRRGVVEVARSASRFSVGTAAKGPPREPSLQSKRTVLGPPVSPTANTQGNKGLQSAVAHPNPNRSDFAKRFQIVKPDFFT
jgi:hypothetical protein